MPNPQPGQEERMDARFAAVDFAAHTSAFRERVKKALTLSRSDFLDKCCFDLGEPKTFKVVDAIGAHDPCYLVIPGGSMLPLNHFTYELTDVCRAIFIAEACNAALTRPASDPGEYVELIDWLRKDADRQDGTDESIVSTNAMRNAADRLETQVATIARLREALVAARMAFGIPNVSDEVKQNAIERIDAALIQTKGTDR